MNGEVSGYNDGIIDFCTIHGLTKVSSISNASPVLLLTIIGLELWPISLNLLNFVGFLETWKHWRAHLLPVSCASVIIRRINHITL